VSIIRTPARIVCEKSLIDVNFESVMVILPLCNQYAVKYTYSYGLPHVTLNFFITRTYDILWNSKIQDRIPFADDERRLLSEAALAMTVPRLVLGYFFSSPSHRVVFSIILRTKGL